MRYPLFKNNNNNNNNNEQEEERVDSGWLERARWVSVELYLLSVVLLGLSAPMEIHGGHPDLQTSYTLWNE